MSVLPVEHRSAARQALRHAMAEIAHREHLVIPRYGVAGETGRRVVVGFKLAHVLDSLPGLIDKAGIGLECSP